MVSLDEFATQREYHCLICESPDRAEIEAAFKKGIHQSTIRHWLIEIKGLEVRGLENALANHLRNHLKHDKP